jgi:hypothetical protein
MIRRWLLLLAVGSIGLPPASFAQVDYDAIRSGTAGCPELAADPAVGDLAAFLCRPADRTTLDLPINAGAISEEVRAGAFSVAQRLGLLTLSRGDIGESEFARLQGLLLAGAVPSRGQGTLARALETEAVLLGSGPLADALRAQAAAIRAGTFDESIPALLASRVDRNRLADLRSGLLQSLAPRDTVSAYADGVASDLGSVAQVSGLPNARDPDGVLLVSGSSSLRNAYPLVTGPDGRANTPDDLPFVRTHPAAQAAGYTLGPPIAGSQDRFDTVSGGLAVYTQTAQKLVDSAASPGTRARRLLRRVQPRVSRPARMRPRGRSLRLEARHVLAPRPRSSRLRRARRGVRTLRLRHRPERGRRLHRSEHVHPDLFAAGAVRGGGPAR